MQEMKGVSESKQMESIYPPSSAGGWEGGIKIHFRQGKDAATKKK